MPRKGKSKPTGKKIGAKPGNKNAEKHGFYSKQFTADENQRVEGTDRHAVESEIDLIRVCMDRLLAELSFDEVQHTDQQGNRSRDSHYLAQLNTLSIMNQSLSTLIRTHYLTRGKGGHIEQSIQEALEELRLELGL